MSMHKTLRAANVARQAEWDSGSKISLAFRVVELAGEVGEVCNIVKKLERERLGIAGSRATVDDLADELADVAICCDLLAMDAGLDGAAGDDVYQAQDPQRVAMMLFAAAGMIAHLATIGGGSSWIKTECTRVINSLLSLADHYDINLAEAVVSKFNATSVKVGLETMMEMPS